MTDEVEPCEACGGPLELLGVLGTIAHYRCRNCGLDARALPAPEPDADENTEQCGQCGEVILGYHRCQGVPGGFPDDED